jgi:hypothetical protein
MNASGTSEIAAQAWVQAVAGIGETQKHRDSTAIACSYLRDVAAEIRRRMARALVMSATLLIRNWILKPRVDAPQIKTVVRCIWFGS